MRDGIAGLRQKCNNRSTVQGQLLSHRDATVKNLRLLKPAIFRIKAEAVEESGNLPAPEVIVADTMADLETALEQFAAIADDLMKWPT